ncbi:MAG: ATP synthase F1 subunit epsilon [Magnetococcales bacterium]|nr:ATP synthase F1 subunit epsilon [Magnetococcales bacterium]
MGNSFQLDVVTPERLLLTGKATFITAPGQDGRFGVLAGHTPLISLLVPGELLVVKEGSTDEHHFALSGGYAEVGNDRVTLLVERAVEKDLIDPRAAEAEEQEALERLTQLPHDGPESSIWKRRRDFARVCRRMVGMA